MNSREEQTIGGFIRGIKSELRAYLEARLELTRLTTYDKAAQLAASLLFFIVAAILVTLVVLFVSIAAGYFLAQLLNSAWQGFGLVAGFYFLLSLLIFIFREKILDSIHTATLEVLMKSDTQKNPSDERERTA